MNIIRLSKSCVGAAEAKVTADVLSEGYLGMGRWVGGFEEELGKRFGGRAATCVNSGTAALHLALASLRLAPGDEVLVPSLTFVATYQAICASGAVPVSCDVDPDTGLMNVEDAAGRVTDRTKAIVPVHYASRTSNLNSVYELAKQMGLRVVEDAAHAFGTVHGGKEIGSFGDIVCFSFDGIKNITSGEGGVVITDDPEVTAFVEDARLLGISKDTEKRLSGRRSWEFDVLHQGYRFHMSNLFAGIGRVQLGRFDEEFKPARQRLAHRYHEHLQDLPGVLLFPLEYDTIVPHIFPIRILGGRREEVREFLRQAAIETGVHYLPNHLLTLFGGGRVCLPQTEQLYPQLLTLPLHPDLTNADQDRVLKALSEVLE